MWSGRSQTGEKADRVNSNNSFEHLVAIVPLTFHAHDLGNGRERLAKHSMMYQAYIVVICLPLKMRTAALHVHASWSSGNGLVTAQQIVVLLARQSSAITMNISGHSQNDSL